MGRKYRKRFPVWQPSPVEDIENEAQGLTTSERAVVVNLDTLVGDWLTVREIVRTWGEDMHEIRRMLATGALYAFRRGVPPEPSLPAAFFQGHLVVGSVPGTLSVLLDAGFSEVEALIWLFSEDATLPGRPVDALRQGRHTEVRRRAQALAW